MLCEYILQQRHTGIIVEMHLLQIFFYEHGYARNLNNCVTAAELINKGFLVTLVCMTFHDSVLQ